MGLQLEVDHLRIAPTIPADWDSYKVHYRFRDTVYHITIQRIGEEASGELIRTRVDGVESPDARIPLVDDRQEHFVEVHLLSD